MSAAQTPLRKARERGKAAIDWLIAAQARRMEALEDKRHGIAVERWLFPNGKSVWLWLTPQWWDILRVCDETSNKAEDTFRAVAEWVQS